MFGSYFDQALPAIFSGLTLILLGWIGNKFVEFRKEHVALIASQKKFEKSFESLVEQQNILIESQRNQIKDAIVVRYQRAIERGYITHMELDTMNRLGDSYFKMNGNSYIDRVLDKANDMQLGGEEIHSDDTFKYKKLNG